MADPNSQPAQEQENIEVTDSNQEAQVQQPALENKTQEESTVLRDLRKKYAKAAQELEALKKAEEDKNRTTEEKLAKAQADVEQLKKEKDQEIRRYQLEKELLANNVNPEFIDLMLAKGSSDDDLSIVVSELKTSYPSAFIKVEDKPKPIGNVGVNATNSQGGVVMTKEEVQRYLLDPNKPMTPEINKLADEYGL